MCRSGPRRCAQICVDGHVDGNMCRCRQMYRHACSHESEHVCRMCADMSTDLCVCMVTAHKIMAFLLMAYIVMAYEKSNFEQRKSISGGAGKSISGTAGRARLAW